MAYISRTRRRGPPSRQVEESNDRLVRASGRSLIATISRRGLGVDDAARFRAAVVAAARRYQFA